MDSLLFILLSVGLFSLVILVMTVMLVLAEKRLVSHGKVSILINNEKTLELEAGNTLATSLATEKIFLSSACGEKGSCGQCKCQVLEGAGDILPTEKSLLTRAELKNNIRLACQVKVKGNLSITVPQDVLSVRKFDCEVLSNNNVASFIKELRLKINTDEPFHFQPGGFILIYIPPYDLSFKSFDVHERYRGAWDHFHLWDLHTSNEEEIFRAYSMANYPVEGNEIKLNVRIATPPPKLDVPPGVSSSYIFSLKPGDHVTVSGPYGDFFIKNTDREMIYIGGGAGMAPMRSQLFHLFKTLKTDRKVSFFYGARSLNEMFYHEEFLDLARDFPNFSYTVALSEPQPEDNWEGPVGFIHDVVYDTYLKDHREPEEIEYYMCGPPPMMAAVNKMLDSLGVEKDMIAYDAF